MFQTFFYEADAVRLTSIVLAFAACVSFFTFPGWHEDVDRSDGELIDVRAFPSRAVLQIIIALLALCFLFALTAGIWQHSAAAAAASTMDTVCLGAVSTDVGATAAALTWASVAVLLVVLAGAVVTLQSFLALDKLTD